MEKNIRDYLHLYLGCEVVHAVVKEPEKLLGVAYFPDRNQWCVRTDRNVKGQFGLMQSYKPILRPLSDMTEEEIKEVAWILHRFKPEDVRGKDSVGNIKVTNRSPFYYWINVRQHLNAECCKYLLSKGFDLFELIESGLAIDKTKQAIK